MSGVTTTEQSLTVDRRTVKLSSCGLSICSAPGVTLFIHGGVWIVGNFENHKRLLRDIVVEFGTAGRVLQ